MDLVRLGHTKLLDFNIGQVHRPKINQVDLVRGGIIGAQFLRKGVILALKVASNTMRQTLLTIG